MSFARQVMKMSTRWVSNLCEIQTDVVPDGACKVTSIHLLSCYNGLVVPSLPCCLFIIPFFPDPLLQHPVISCDVATRGLASNVTHQIVLDLQSMVKGCYPVSVKRLMEAQLPTLLTCGWSWSNLAHVVVCKSRLETITPNRSLRCRAIPS